MIEYNKQPSGHHTVDDVIISSFVTTTDDNLDKKTVDSFGEEWNKFNEFDLNEIEEIGNDYFDLVDFDSTNLKNETVLDVGCGSGRWAKFLSNKVHFIEAIDPSNSVFTAASFLKSCDNVRVTQCSIETIPFKSESFDMVYSLGVLHHIPDTERAIRECVKFIKPGGAFLLYLYYSLDGRGFFYKLLFHCSNIVRRVVSIMAPWLKKVVCDLIALTVYLPLSRISLLISKLPKSKKIVQMIPLSYYKKTSFNIQRNDALDRFGTPLEKRFSKEEIRIMLENTGLQNIVFSDKAPYWHVIAKKA